MQPSHAYSHDTPPPFSPPPPLHSDGKVRWKAWTALLVCGPLAPPPASGRGRPSWHLLSPAHHRRWQRRRAQLGWGGVLCCVWGTPMPCSRRFRTLLALGRGAERQAGGGWCGLGGEGGWVPQRRGVRGGCSPPPPCPLPAPPSWPRQQPRCRGSTQGRAQATPRQHDPPREPGL